MQNIITKRQKKKHATYNPMYNMSCRMYIKDILYDSSHFPHKTKLHFIHLGMAHL